MDARLAFWRATGVSATNMVRGPLSACKPFLGAMGVTRIRQEFRQIPQNSPMEPSAMPTVYAESREHLPGTDTILSMSGLDFMLAVLDGRIPGPPIANLMNFRLDRVERGHTAFRGAPVFDCLNPMGTVHGGWYGALLDSAMACAVMTEVPKGAMYTTLEYRVNIIRPIPLEMEIIAEGRIRHAGRSTGVADGEIRGAGDGRLYATGSTTCMILTPDPRPDGSPDRSG